MIHHKSHAYFDKQILQSHIASLENKCKRVICLRVPDFSMSILSFWYFCYFVFVSRECFSLPQLCIPWNMAETFPFQSSVGVSKSVCVCVCVRAPVHVCVCAHIIAWLCMCVRLLNSMTRTAFWNFLLKCSLTSLFASYPKAKLLSFIHSSKAHKWNGRRKCTFFPERE